jgi:glutathione S-transferase
MQLYFAPFACSLASHITSLEADLPVELISVALASKRTGAGEDFLAISPKGQVPALLLDNGAVLTEGPAVLQYLADAAPSSGLLPAPADEQRYRVIEWLNYVGTEVHKLCFYLMFAPDAPAEAKAWGRSLLDKKLAYVNAHLQGREFVATPQFTIADAYLTWALTLCQKIGVKFDDYPAAAAYLLAMHARPAVQTALMIEAAAAARQAG